MELSPNYTLCLNLQLYRNSIHCDVNTKSITGKELLKISPKLGILGLLDLIFDFFTFEDLERMALV